MLCSCVIARKESQDGKILSPHSLIPIPKAHKAIVIMGSIDSSSDIANSLVCNYHDVVVVSVFTYSILDFA